MIDASVPRKLKLLERLQISDCVSGEQLACGCIVGRYLTRTGHVLTVVDDDADDCAERAHQVDFVIGDVPADTPERPPSEEARRASPH